MNHGYILCCGSEGAKEAAAAALAELARSGRGPAKICDAGAVPLLVGLVDCSIVVVVVV